MSVIIRLQNLPWSANALDIRQFFKGLSIPEGGVHIVGGEMGDAFIAFSTDEDARQAMMHDREKINEVQVRLLLSSRAEMQKVIETARQQSLLALQNGGTVLPKVAVPSLTPTTTAATIGNPQPPIITANNLQNILSNTLGAAPSFLAYQQQAGITLNDASTSISQKSVVADATGGRRNSGDTTSRDRRRSTSRERRRSRDRGDRVSSSSSSRRRHERSRSRSRERDYKGRRSSRRSKSRERSHERSRDRSRDRNRNSNRNVRNSKEQESGSNNRKDVQKSSSHDVASKKDPRTTSISPWNIPLTNAYQTNFVPNSNSTLVTQKNSNNPFATNNPQGSNTDNPFNTVGSRSTEIKTAIPNSYTTANKETVASAILPAFQSYSTSSTTTNNYSINLFGNTSSLSTTSESVKAFALQNPYTTALQISGASKSNSQDSNSNASTTMGTLPSQTNTNSTMFPGLFLDKKPEQPSDGQGSFQQIAQEPIAFANTNPYAQIYPNLFAQAAALGTTPRNSLTTNQKALPSVRTASPTNNDGDGFGKSPSDSCCIKVSNLCNSVTYSDLRKFFSGLFIPHNGIKMVNDRHGLRIGTGYIQFSRVSSVQKALTRNNTALKTKPIKIEIVPDEEFEHTEDSYRPQQNRAAGEQSWPNSDGDRDNDSSSADNSNAVEPFSVLYIEDIPAFATEQDIMKMFSSYTIIDIFLMPKPENRREFIAHVKFSRNEEARTALEDKSRHLIGYRKVRVRPGKLEDMENAKEKVRLANEQLIKEEQALAEEEAANEERREEERAVKKRMFNGIDNMEDSADSTSSDFKNKSGFNKRDPRSSTNIPSIFEVPSSKSNGPTDPRLRNRQKSNNNQNNNNNNSGSGNKEALSPNMAQAGNFNNEFSSFPPNANPAEMCFVILKNCDYNTRMNDVASLFLPRNFSLKHIEPLRNERDMFTGEFIVEFNNPHDAERATEELNNTSFRSRNLRVRSITPQEIADRLGKPFMNFFPGGGNVGNGRSGNFEFMGRGGGPGSGLGPHLMMGQRGIGLNMGPMGQPPRFGGSMIPPIRGSRGRGMVGGMFRPNMFLGSRARGDVHMQFNSLERKEDEDVIENVDGHIDMNIDLNDMDRAQMDNEEENYDTTLTVKDNEESGKRVGGDKTGSAKIDGIPEKFNRPGCVLSMQNVPFKADLRTIMKFFSDFELSPDDIIRRFNDDGSPTGDARVAFETPDIAREAFEAKKRKSIFNRTIYLEIL